MQQFEQDLYGEMRTRTFSDIFPTAIDFRNDYSACDIDLSEFGAAADTIVGTLYALLYGYYGNSHIASMDETQFKYKLFSIIYSYGPSWKKRQDIQKKLRDLTEADLTYGGRSISNHANNPSTSPSTDAFTPLTFIDNQNASSVEKSKLEAYAQLWTVIDTDVTHDFIMRFRTLFLQIVNPELPLLYGGEEIYG